LIQPRLAEFSFDVVLLGEAKSAVRLHRNTLASSQDTSAASSLAMFASGRTVCRHRIGSRRAPPSAGPLPGWRMRGRSGIERPDFCRSVCRRPLVRSRSGKCAPETSARRRCIPKQSGFAPRSNCPASSGIPGLLRPPDFRAGTSRLSKNNSVVAWFIIVRMGRILNPCPTAWRRSTKIVERPSVRFLHLVHGRGANASSSIRSECSAREIQIFCPLIT
jgi:hypothetical protein